MIEIKNVSYISGHREILVDINLTINKGDFIAIVGPNGAGKTTLLKIILNMINDYQGKVFIEGLRNDLWLKQNIIGYLPQKETFDKDFPATVEDIVLMGLAGKKGILKRFNNQDRESVDEALKQVDVQHLKKNLIGTLSGGEFQRVLIARSLITGSDYLFLDEPEAGVDDRSVVDFFNLLIRLNKLKKTIVIISHDINMVLKYCTHLVCLNKTLHCHTKSELATAEMIQKSYGEVMQIVEKHY